MKNTRNWKSVFPDEAEKTGARRAYGRRMGKRHGHSGENLLMRRCRCIAGADLRGKRKVRHGNLSLEVRSDNARGIALYRKFDFEKTGVFRHMMQVNGTYVDYDVMQRVL